MIEYICRDWYCHKIRFVVEFCGLVIGIAMSILLALTTPTPPMVYAYIGWLISACLLGGGAWHRGSFGLTALYVAYFIIDGIGLLRTLGVL